MGVGQGTGSGEGLALVNAAKSETWGLNLATEGPSSKRSPTPYKESDMIRTIIASLLFLGAIYGAIYAVHDGILWLSFTAGICVAAAVEVLRK